MTKKEFNAFLDDHGGLVLPKGKTPSPINLFGIERDDGSLQLISELILELINAGWTREIVQIKEKFGMINFYAEGLPENGFEIIHKHEMRSFSICEKCGSEINVRTLEEHWVKTLCDDCAKVWQEEYANRFK